MPQNIEKIQQGGKKTMDDEKIVYLLTRYSTLRMRINQPCPRERPNSIQHRKTVSHTQDRASGSQKSLVSRRSDTLGHALSH